eukprot:scaffold500380_cov52-Prasinocladus_malaysianus.AAC.1
MSTLPLQPTLPARLPRCIVYISFKPHSKARLQETPTRAGACTLPYPERFHAALQYMSKPPA